MIVERDWLRLREATAPSASRLRQHNGQRHQNDVEHAHHYSAEPASNGKAFQQPIRFSEPGPFAAA